ncbi:MAG: hypothetical protein A2W11_01880 [Ignavibacteria bacterium RBG_16_35_7]|nr:MAG: hypothetical protein A2W11_01880 [Ignavibacteria bacterium RBG_16_35_7]
MIKIVIQILFTVLLFIEILAQVNHPKREFRGVWVATVANIDWPSSKLSSSENQITELKVTFDKLKEAGINAVIFQVRTECDALYSSSFEPWSYWLTGEQGKAPEPFFDPLQIAIDEAHKRGMELHAWFNPYRAVKSVDDYIVSDFHVSKVHPEWILTFGNYKMLDPGIPEVKEYIVSIVEEVIRNYDVDGIHFDDYFYPYSPKVSNEDSLTFINYGNNFINIDDWRRHNINSMVALVNEKINSFKPHIKFGISPFGIVENKYAGTNGFNSYSILFCDPLTWIKDKTVDYVTPQIYWEIGHNLADYSLLLPWWVSIIGDRHLYIGHFSSRFTAKRYEGKKSEMGDQLRINREYSNAGGSVFFSAKSITNNYSGFADTLKNNFYKYPALVPLMNWKDNILPYAPKSFYVEKKEKYYHLEWEPPDLAIDGDAAKYFVVYISASNNDMDFDDPQNIFTIVDGNATELIHIPEFDYEGQICFAISSLDKVQNESIENPIVIIE